MLSHHMVIRDGKIANYHPYPPTPWNAQPARHATARPGPYEDAVQNTPIFEENDREHFKGIDIMRTVRSFDPCLPCGVHMYLGDGKEPETAALAHAVRHRRLAPMSSRARRAPRPDVQAVGRADRGAARRQLRSRPAPRPRERAEELVRLLVELYGAGLAASLEIARRARALDAELLDALVADDAGGEPAAGARPAPATTSTTGSSARWSRSGPTSARTAATSSCSASRTTGVVRLRLLGSCDGCPSSAVTLELAVEEAIEAAAPEVTVDRGGDADQPQRRRGRARVIPVAALRARLEPAPAARRRPGSPCRRDRARRARSGGFAVGGTAAARLPDRQPTCSPSRDRCAGAAARHGRRASSSGDARLPRAATAC